MEQQHTCHGIQEPLAKHAHPAGRFCDALRRLQTLHLLHHFVQLALGRLVPLLGLLVLLLPLVALLLGALDLALELLGTHVRLAEPEVSASCTYCSTVSLRFFSEASSCSSSISMRRCRISTFDLWLSPSSLPIFASLSFVSADSRSDSSTESLCCRLVISCSFCRLSCSSSLFFCSATSARSRATSAS